MSTETKRMFIPAKYAALVLPSSCSLSHPEIRYRGDACPLCEAKELIRELSSYAKWPKESRAALSRPSSDPGAKPKCLPECRKEPTYPSNGIGWSNSDGFKVIHATACPTLKPGAGEVGK